MTCLEWAQQMTALREGKLRLAAPGEDGLSLYARGRFDDLIEYLKALEHGYRAVCETLDGYRMRERVRPALRAKAGSLQELVENQWSNDAALGYAAMGMRSAKIRPDQGVLALDAMMEAMEHYSLEEARNYERGLREGDGGTCAGGTGDPSPTETRDGGDGGQGSGRHTGTADGEMPRELGPSAEFVPEGQRREQDQGQSAAADLHRGGRQAGGKPRNRNGPPAGAEDCAIHFAGQARRPAGGRAEAGCRVRLAGRAD